MTQNLRKNIDLLVWITFTKNRNISYNISVGSEIFGISIDVMWILVSAFIATVNSAVWGPINETFLYKIYFY